MIQKTLVTLLFILQTTFLFSNNTWNSLTSKTWFSEKGMAGYQIVFYETKNGLPKAIKQIHGSGVYVISSEIYDVEIIGNTIHLINGVNLITKDKIEEASYTFDANESLLLEDGKNLKAISSESFIYNWTYKAWSGARVNTRMLFDLPLGKGEIYDMSQIKNMSVEIKKNR